MLKFVKPLICKLSKAYAKQKEGVAAIEFALIAPIMITFYFGVSELSVLIATDRDVAHAASVAGDLATQSETLAQADVETIMEAALTVANVDSDNVNSLSVELNSFELDANNQLNQVGHALMGSAISSGAFNPSEIPASMTTGSSGVVVARVDFKYQPLIADFLLSELVLHETFYLKPRKSLSIPFEREFKCNASGGSVSC